MSPNIVILSLVGTLMVILNKPIGVTLYRARLGLGDKDNGVWSFRIPTLFIGVLLTCLSFAVYE
ncbi:MAG: hypothetical protein QOH49_4379 [Acidobacteriota bacterium]|jgi:hypothetical protein|nr:hypothetical protein [Acidobacteriota bacterium]